MIVDFSAFSKARRKPKETGPDSIPKQTTNPLDTNPADQFSSLHEPTDASVPDRIQILDLHTSNPLISYQSQLYTCDWTTTIGTDMILSPTALGPSPLLFTTRYKLLARPASLTSNVAAPSASLPPPPPPNPPDACLTPNPLSDQPPTSTPKSPKPAAAPLETRASLVRQRQTAFLERLTAAKVARGETDQITMHSQRRFTGTGWRSRQKQAATEEAEAEPAAEAEAEAEDLEAGFSPAEENGQGSSKRGKNETPRRAKMGRPRGRGQGRGQHRESLFGNPIPESGDILSAANLSTSSIINTAEPERPPQQVGSLANEDNAISIPSAQTRSEQDQGMPGFSSAASAQQSTEATKIGEDVIMQDS